MNKSTSNPPGTPDNETLHEAGILPKLLASARRAPMLIIVASMLGAGPIAQAAQNVTVIFFTGFACAPSAQVVKLINSSAPARIAYDNPLYCGPNTMFDNAPLTCHGCTYFEKRPVIWWRPGSQPENKLMGNTDLLAYLEKEGVADIWVGAYFYVGGYQIAELGASYAEVARAKATSMESRDALNLLRQYALKEFHSAQ